MMIPRMKENFSFAGLLFAFCSRALRPSFLALSLFSAPVEFQFLKKRKRGEKKEQGKDRDLPFACPLGSKR